MNVRMKDGSTTSIPIQEIRKLTFSGFSTAVDDPQLETFIKTFAILQNYPNPFNPNTIIRYQIPKAEHVSIKVYDIMGRLVQVLADGVESPGSKSVEFTGKDLPSGVYFYKLIAGNFNESKKMILMK